MIDFNQTQTAPPPFRRPFGVVKAEQDQTRRLHRLLRHIGDELVAQQLETMRVAEGAECSPWTRFLGVPDDN